MPCSFYNMCYRISAASSIPRREYRPRPVKRSSSELNGVSTTSMAKTSGRLILARVPVSVKCLVSAWAWIFQWDYTQTRNVFLWLLCESLLTPTMPLPPISCCRLLWQESSKCSWKMCMTINMHKFQFFFFKMCP